MSKQSSRKSVILNGVKILDDAVRELGGIPGVHRALTQAGVIISDTALYNAYSGKSNSLKLDVVSALVRLVYKGDWAKCGKAIDADYLPAGLKK